MVTLPPYADLLGITVELIDGAPQLTLPFGDGVVGRPGFLHGGAIGGLLELAGVTALRHHLGATEVVVRPVTITVDYMRGGRAATTYADAQVRRAGARVANVDARAWQEEGRPIAAARLTFRLDRSGPLDPSGTREA